jgi:hypothetical protein
MEEPMTKATTEHDRAEQLLSAALDEQQRSSDRYDAATGKSDHVVAEVALHAADQEVAARDAWLKWVDDENYHGINAGPFELSAEESTPQAKQPIGSPRASRR